MYNSLTNRQSEPDNRRGASAQTSRKKNASCCLYQGCVVAGRRWKIRCDLSLRRYTVYRYTVYTPYSEGFDILLGHQAILDCLVISIKVRSRVTHDRRGTSWKGPNDLHAMLNEGLRPSFRPSLYGNTSQ